MSTPLDAKAKTLPQTTAVSEENRRKIADMLGEVLSSTYVLYHKTHGYHWNVAGPLIYSVHKLTDDQYNDLEGAVDDIAERIRALGMPAPMGLGGYVKASAIEDVSGFPDAGDMIRELAHDHLAVADQMRPVVEAAEDVKDVFTADLLTARIGVHEEAAWMLNAIVAE